MRRMRWLGRFGWAVFPRWTVRHGWYRWNRVLIVRFGPIVFSVSDGE